MIKAFFAKFPEFADIGEVDREFVCLTLAVANSEVNRNKWGSFSIDAVLFLTAHKLMVSWFDEPCSFYSAELARLGNVIDREYLMPTYIPEAFVCGARL